MYQSNESAFYVAYQRRSVELCLLLLYLGADPSVFPHSLQDYLFDIDGCPVLGEALVQQAIVVRTAYCLYRRRRRLDDNENNYDSNSNNDNDNDDNNSGDGNNENVNQVEQTPENTARTSTIRSMGDDWPGLGLGGRVEDMHCLLQATDLCMLYDYL